MIRTALAAASLALMTAAAPVFAGDYDNYGYRYGYRHGGYHQGYNSYNGGIVRFDNSPAYSTHHTFQPGYDSYNNGYRNNYSSYGYSRYGYGRRCSYNNCY
jgi:hypothetical protein